ncbi:MAG: ribonuclease HII [Fusobacteria bacterium]|nr:ribonuclease HII [Fusobacteriota bacterium]
MDINNELYNFDKNYNKIVVGVDEAGRGPLAGPVVAAAVIINEYLDDFIQINDSKKLTEKKREKLYEIIMLNCIVGIGEATVAEIEEVNILNATFLAMKRAVLNLKKEYDIILVDGNHLIKGLEFPQEAIISGDKKSLSIAAASIIAKVTRDRQMVEYAKIYDRYGFEKHKGYGTKLHVENIKKHGCSEIHRQSFLTKII